MQREAREKFTEPAGALLGHSNEILIFMLAAFDKKNRHDLESFFPEINAKSLFTNFLRALTSRRSFFNRNFCIEKCESNN